MQFIYFYLLLSASKPSKSFNAQLKYKDYLCTDNIRRKKPLTNY